METKKKAFKKAIRILAQDEVLAVDLAKVQGKSTWQAGEIMSKSHYKYIEILQRGEHFLKIFTKHFEIYDTLIPEQVGINNDIKEYLIKVMEQRLKPTTVIREHSTMTFRVDSTKRDALFGFELLKWRSSGNAHEQYFYHLVMEFDRWNNYRILPMRYQEPHAFKRRQKNRHRKILQLTTKVDLDTIKNLTQDFVVDTFRVGSKTGYYTYLAESLRDNNFKIVVIKKTPKAIEAFTNQKIYVFRSPNDCLIFVKAAREYLIDQSEKVQRGLKFWPTFRIMIKKAVNYNQMERVTPERAPYMIDALTKEGERVDIQLQKKARSYIKKLKASIG